MKMDDIGGLIVLVILFALVAGILYMLVRFWHECRFDTAYARERVTWPTTTVQASLFDTSLRPHRRHPPSVIGHYRYEFGGSEHTAEVYEGIPGSREDREAAARKLKQEGKTLELEVQYDPNDSTVASNEIVTYVPSCRWWIGGFFVFFSVMMLLIVRGFYKLLIG